MMSFINPLFACIRSGLIFAMIPISVEWLVNWSNEGLVEFFLIPVLSFCLMLTSLVFGGVNQGADGVFQQVFVMFILGFIYKAFRLRLWTKVGIKNS